jgi:hypothetical protein
MYSRQWIVRFFIFFLIIFLSLWAYTKVSNDDYCNIIVMAGPGIINFPEGNNEASASNARNGTSL